MFLGIGLVVGGIVGWAVTAGASGNGAPTRAVASSSSTAVALSPTAEPTIPDEAVSEEPIPEETSPYVPVPSDFDLTVKIRSKQCFGSAGCNITFRILVAYSGPPLDPSITYDVTYRVTGDESGPQINTLQVTGDQSSVDAEEIASTSSSSVKLVATPISVDVA